MADNTRLPQPASNGDLVATDEITGGVANGAKVQRVKLGFGADGAYADVEGSDPLPVTGAVTVSGVATAAAQATAQTALDAIKVATEAGATAAKQDAAKARLDTIASAQDVAASTRASESTLALVLGAFAALATSAAQATAQTALDAINSKLSNALPLPTGAATASAQATAQSTLSGLATQTTLAAIQALLPSALVGGRLDVNVGASALPSGAATQTTLAAILAALPSALVGGRFPVDGSGVTQPVSASQLPAALGQALAAACMPVVLPVAQDVVAYAGVNGAIKFRPSIVASDKQSSLAATGKLITATGAALYYYVKNSSGGAIFLQIFNSATQPSTGDRADGYTVSISNGGLSNGAFGQNTHGIPCPNGVYLVASSTQDTYTPIVSTAVLYTAIYLQG